MKYSNNRDFIDYVASLVAGGRWRFIPKGSRKHGCLKHRNGRQCPVPGSPAGDPRGLLNFKSRMRQIELAAE